MVKRWPRLNIQQQSEIIKLYLGGLSSIEIKDTLSLPHSVRAIQLLIHNHGVSRDAGEAFKLAIVKGRMKYKKLLPGYGAKEARKSISTTLRYEVLKRDNFRCKLCGSGAENGIRLEVDHIIRPIKGGKNEIGNLRTLCTPCNVGRWHVEK